MLTLYQILRELRAGGMAQAVKHPPNKHKALSANPSAAKRWGGEREREIYKFSEQIQ
jgi:hypothetical protein